MIWRPVLCIPSQGGFQLCLLYEAGNRAAETLVSSPTTIISTCVRPGRPERTKGLSGEGSENRRGDVRGGEVFFTIVAEIPGYPTRKLLFGGPLIRTNAGIFSNISMMGDSS